MEIARLENRAEEVVTLLTAMANAKRLMVLCNLLDRELSVGELETRVSLSQSALSQHLAKLRALKLVSARREGVSIYYSLASSEVRQVLSTLYGLYCARG